MPLAFEHEPWIGSKYKAGKGIAIVGHSHWLNPDEEDSPGYTPQVLCLVSNNLVRLHFFSSIYGYFDEYCKENEFWEHMMFFNLLPQALSERYGNGTKTQRKQARPRFETLIKRYQPVKVLVFTRKGWPLVPRTEERHLGQRLPPSFTEGILDTGEWCAKVFGLRHPQGANGTLMRSAVKKILDQPPKTICEHCGKETS